MSHLAHGARTPSLAFRLSFVPLLCGNLVETLRSEGATIPGQIKDYLMGIPSDLGLPSAEQWEFLHAEYLREVFAAFGDSSKVVSEDALIFPERLELPYKSSFLESTRKGLRSSISAGAPLHDLPRWRWVIDPYLAAHWRLIQAADLATSSAYQDFLRTVALSKADDLHRGFLASSGLSGLLDARTASDVRAVVESSLSGSSVICIDKRRCTRSCLVLCSSVNEQIDLVLVLDDLRVPGLGSDGRVRPFFRLISSQAKHMMGPSAEGIILQVPINEVVPGANVYSQWADLQAFTICLAFNVRLFELLVPAFVAAIQNDLPTS